MNKLGTKINTKNRYRKIFSLKWFAQIAAIIGLVSLVLLSCDNTHGDLNEDSDATAPTAGDSGTISVSNVTTTTVDLSWQKASDNITAEADLQYKVVYSESNNVDTVSDAETNGTVVKDWTADINSTTVTNLKTSTTYYFNVIVRDAAGNKAAYATTSGDKTKTDYTSLYADLNAGLTGVEEGSSSFADVDGDGDQDVLVTGSTGFDPQTGPITETTLYINEGNGSFTGANAGLENVYDSSSEFADVDGDGDQDLVVMGEKADSSDTAVLYLNDGSGSFSSAGAGLTGRSTGSVSFADVNGNGAPDLLITGSYATDLYVNDGNGNYTAEATPVDSDSDGTGDTYLPKVTFSSSDFADVDGDGDQELVVTGYDGIDALAAVSKLYINDGNAVFSEASTSLDAVDYGSSTFGDVDGDVDMDLLLTGNDNSKIAVLYINNGSGSFTKDSQSSNGSSPVFTGVYFSSSNCVDIDADGDKDILVTGRDASSNYLATLYINGGNGDFSTANAGLEGVYNGSSDFGDLEGDGDQDLIVTGSSPSSIAKIYENTLY